MPYRLRAVGLGAVAVVLLAAPPALWAQTRQGNDQDRTGRIRTYEGVITRVDLDRGMLTLAEVRDHRTSRSTDRGVRNQTSGKEWRFQVPKDTKIAIDHLAAKFGDLKAGMRARVTAGPGPASTNTSGERITERGSSTLPTDRVVSGRSRVGGQDRLAGATREMMMTIQIDANDRSKTSRTPRR